MRYFSWFLTILIVLAAVTFTVTNRYEMTTVWPLPGPAPVSVIIFAAFFVGFLLGGLVTWFSGGKRRQRARQAREHANVLARQVADLQRQPPAAPTLSPAGSADSRLPAA